MGPNKTKFEEIISNITYHDIEFWVQDFAEVNEFFLDLGEKFQTFGFFLLVDKYSTHYMIDEIT